MTFVCRGKVFLVFPETNNNNLRDKKVSVHDPN